MIPQKSIFSSILRARQFNQASRIQQSGRNFHALAQIPHSAHTFPGPAKNSSILSNLDLKFGSVSVSKNVPLPFTFCFRSYTDNGKQTEFEAGNTRRSIDANPDPLSKYIGDEYIKSSPLYRGPKLDGNNAFGTGFSFPSIDFTREENTRGGAGAGAGAYTRFPLYQAPRLEGNADIVHIKLMRNNAFVTLTDYKGNKRLGVSAGKLAGKGGKMTRYSADAAAEEIGRKVRELKINSVVVKVNGSTFFRKKKQAVLSFREGFTNSRGDRNPVVYVEDTTRKPHNGCRLRKKRRI